MQQFLLTPPHQMEQAQSLGLPLGHTAFRLGPEGRLAASPLPPGKLGGLMVVGVTDSPGQDKSPRAALGEMLQVCQRRGFSGVVLDLECPPTAYLAALIRGLEANLKPQGRTLFLPESYANYSDWAALCFSSALSGGSLEKRVKEILDRYGPERVVLSFHRAAEDFFLPAPKGEGRPLSPEELTALRRRLDPAVFYSPHLCAHYFTYMSRETGAHFVLFDDQASLKKKAALARSWGVQTGFWVYPQIAQWPELFREKP